MVHTVSTQPGQWSISEAPPLRSELPLGGKVREGSAKPPDQDSSYTQDALLWPLSAESGPESGDSTVPLALYWALGALMPHSAGCDPHTCYLGPRE